MDQLIPVIDQLREVLATAKLPPHFKSFDLPQVAVVGGQSVGKSSILEAMVGRSFLPTGSGVVTRRPLVLQLCDTRASGSDREWGEFQHQRGREYDDFNDIRDEIIADTRRICGSMHTISCLPIFLKVSSPRVVNLTLVDLPGIARVPLADQPEDLETLIHDLVIDYIVQPRCLILAVLAGNADLATADALGIAREVDPEGERTIGVMTKLDLVEHGSDLLPVLDGNVYPLKLGFVGVACRSREVGEQCRLNYALEEQFFRDHPLYGSIASKCGTKVLAKNLNRLLLNHIRCTFPALKAHALKLIHEHEVELQGLGECAGTLASEQAALLLGMFETFAGRFSGVIDGKLSKEQTSLIGQLVGRARIDFILRDVFAKTLEEFDCLQGLTDSDFRDVIQNSAGTRTPLLFPEAAFAVLVKKQIAKLEAPSLQCAELIYQELQRVVALSQLPEFRRFVNLRDRLFGVTRGILNKCYEPACQMIKDRVQIELAYINTSHPDFTGVGGIRALATSRPHVEGSVKSGSFSVEPSTEKAVPSIKEDAPASPAPPGFFSSLFGRREQRRSPPLLSPRRSGVPARVDHGGSGTSTTSTFKLREMPANIASSVSPPTARETIVVGIVKELLAKYFSIVKKNITDSVQKIVMFYMVNSIKESIHRECVAQLFKEEFFEFLLQESNDVQGLRKDCREGIRTLRHVLDVIDKVKIVEV